MSIANFGSFVGGLAQGQQAAEAQRERAQYLLMLQKRQKDADEETSSTRDALFANNFEAGSGSDPSTLFGPNALPMAQQAPAPSPGQASVPGAQPLPPGAPQAQGAYAPPKPMPVVAPQPQAPVPQQAGPGAPQGGPPQGPPGAQPMPQPPQAQPMPQPPPAGLQQPPGNGFAQAEAALAQVQAALSTPEAQQVAQDSKVQAASKRYHDYIESLKSDGIVPGGKRPDLVQMKRLQLLHDDLGLAAADASKHISADRKVQYELGTKFADLYAKKQASENVLKSREDATAQRGAAAAARAGGGAGGGEADPARVNFLVDYFKTNGTFPSRTAVNDPARREAERVLGGASGAAAEGQSNKALNVANAASVKGLTQRLGVINETASQLDGLEPQIIDVAQRVAKLPGMSQSTSLNKLAMGAQQNFAGNPDAQKLVTLLQAWKTGYGRLITQNTGAGGTPVFALHKSDEVANGNMPVSQLKATFEAAQAERKLGHEAMQKEIDRQSKQTADRGKSGGSAAPAASGGAYKAPNGKTYTQDQINDAANSVGEDPEAFARARGLTRGN